MSSTINTVDTTIVNDNNKEESKKRPRVEEAEAREEAREADDDVFVPDQLMFNYGAESYERTEEYKKRVWFYTGSEDDVCEVLDKNDLAHEDFKPGFFLTYPVMKAVVRKLHTLMRCVHDDGEYAAQIADGMNEIFNEVLKKKVSHPDLA